jgi:hypothetical protein
MADNPRNPASESTERETDRGYDEAVRGHGEDDSEEMIVGEDPGDVDPDSASADIDRDDTIEDV